jgi:VanZ family protein
MSVRSRWLVAWAPALGYMLLIWALSSLPTQFDFSRVPFHDKGVHFVEYGTLAVLLAHAFHGSLHNLSQPAVLALAFATATLWGLSDEIHQAFVPGRVSDVNDLLADAFGALLGAVTYWLMRQVLRHAHRPHRD